jgi:hypothetical protein
LEEVTLVEGMEEESLVEGKEGEGVMERVKEREAGEVKDWEGEGVKGMVVEEMKVVEVVKGMEEGEMESNREKEQQM